MNPSECKENRAKAEADVQDLKGEGRHHEWQRSLPQRAFSIWGGKALDKEKQKNIKKVTNSSTPRARQAMKINAV